VRRAPQKGFVHGESVMDEVAEEMKKTFTEEERKLIENGIKAHIYRLF